MKVSAKYIVLAVVDEEIPCVASFAEAVAYEAGLAHPVQYMGATGSVCLYLRVSVYLLRPVRRTSESLGLAYVRSFGTGSCEMLVKGGCNLRVLERRKLEHLKEGSWNTCGSLCCFSPGLPYRTHSLCTKRCCGKSNVVPKSSLDETFAEPFSTP